MGNLNVNGVRVGFVTPYEDAFRRLILFSKEKFNIRTSSGYSIGVHEEKTNSLKEYLDFTRENDKLVYLKNKIDYLQHNKKFSIKDGVDIESIMNASILRNKIDGIIKDYELVDKLDKEEKDKLINYLNELSDSLINDIQSFIKEESNLTP